jgi:hypothetical protein
MTDCPKYEHWWCTEQEAYSTDESSIALTDLLRFLFASYSNIDLSKLSFFTIGGQYADFSSKIHRANTNNQVTIYFNGENTKQRFLEYQDETQISGAVDVIASFWSDGGANAMRFPLWLIYYPYYSQGLFVPNESAKQIAATCINRHDMYGTRSQFIRECIQHQLPLFTNLPIRAPGVSMIQLGSSRSDKHQLLSKFMFNICAENTITPGYTTEKIFHAVQAGCIPLYNGPDPVEPGILNQRRVFRELNGKLVQIAGIIQKLPVWDKHALYNIFLMYLELWVRIKRAYERKTQTKLTVRENTLRVTLSVESAENIPQTLETHWSQTRNLLVPLVQIQLQDECLDLEECWERGYLVKM